MSDNSESIVRDSKTIAAKLRELVSQRYRGWSEDARLWMLRAASELDGPISPEANAPETPAVSLDDILDPVPAEEADALREYGPSAGKSVQSTGQIYELIELLEARERKHDAFRLAETAHHECRADSYYEELGQYDAAHGTVQDWLNDSDHLTALARYLRATQVSPETAEQPWMAAADRLLEKIGYVTGIEPERKALLAFMPTVEVREQPS
jgi:hypothetical protein